MVDKGYIPLHDVSLAEKEINSIAEGRLLEMKRAFPSCEKSLSSGGREALLKWRERSIECLFVYALYIKVFFSAVCKAFMTVKMVRRIFSQGAHYTKL